jgi:hypothetical protein
MRFIDADRDHPPLLDLRMEVASSAHPAGAIVFRWDAGVSSCVVLRYPGNAPFDPDRAAGCTRTVIDKCASVAAYDLSSDRRGLSPRDEITLCVFARQPAPPGEEECLIRQPDSVLRFCEPATIWYCVNAPSSERRGLFRRERSDRPRFLRIRCNARVDAEEVRYAFSPNAQRSFILPRAVERDETLSLGPIPALCEDAYVFADASRFHIVRTDTL